MIKIWVTTKLLLNKIKISKRTNGFLIKYLDLIRLRIRGDKCLMFMSFSRQLRIAYYWRLYKMKIPFFPHISELRWCKLMLEKKSRFVTYYFTCKKMGEMSHNNIYLLIVVSRVPHHLDKRHIHSLEDIFYVPIFCILALKGFRYMKQVQL